LPQKTFAMPTYRDELRDSTGSEGPEANMAACLHPPAIFVSNTGLGAKSGAVKQGGDWPIHI
jgi:hypothetical protein